MGRERIGNTKESTKHQWKIRENQYLHCSSTGNEWVNQLEIKLKGKISQKLHWDKIKAYEREGKINQINLRNILQKASTKEELENKVGIHKNERHIQSREKSKKREWDYKRGKMFLWENTEGHKNCLRNKKLPTNVLSAYSLKYIQTSQAHTISSYWYLKLTPTYRNNYLPFKVISMATY